MYEYGVGETWKAWPLALRLNEMHQVAEKRVSEIVDGYLQPIIERYQTASSIIVQVCVMYYYKTTVKHELFTDFRF